MIIIIGCWGCYQSTHALHTIDQRFVVVARGCQFSPLPWYSTSQFICTISTRKHIYYYQHPDVNNGTIIWKYKHFLIEFVNSLIRYGNAETKFTPVVTRGVANTPSQCNDPSIVHKGTKGTMMGKLVMSRNKLPLSIFDNLQYYEG